MAEAKQNLFDYNEDSIKSLDWRSISACVLVYIGKLGDGNSADDGIYVLLKEVLDNCIDEHMMGYRIDITVEGKTVTVRIMEGYSPG